MIPTATHLNLPSRITSGLFLRRRISSLFLGLSLAGCGVETVVHQIDEREANHIIELFADSDIAATKGMVDTGRSVSFSITVPAKSKLEAVRLLNRNARPRRLDMGYNEIFKEGGLIPTAAEEHAKQLSALEGEIEKQLKLVDGILDVSVQLVLPEETALRTAQDVRSPTTASVTVKYLPVSGSAKPLSEPQIQAIVAAGVEKLTPDNVVVVMTPVAAPGRAPNDGLFSSDALKGVSDRRLNMIAVFLGGAVVVMFIFMAIAQLRLRTVRNRLTRLQNEIAKARKKPADLPAPPANQI